MRWMLQYPDTMKEYALSFVRLRLLPYVIGTVWQVQDRQIVITEQMEACYCLEDCYRADKHKW